MSPSKMYSLVFSTILQNSSFEYVLVNSTFPSLSSFGRGSGDVIVEIISAISFLASSYCALVSFVFILTMIMSFSLR